MVDDRYEQTIHFVMTDKALQDYMMRENKKLAIWASYFQLIADQVYKMGPDDILCRYVLLHEQERILFEAHDEFVGGNYGGCTTAKKILRAGLSCLTIHNDVAYYTKSCDFVRGLGSHLDETRCHWYIK